MTSANAPLISLAWDEFDPMRVTPLTHTFTDHPLLQRDALVELGRRCRGTNRWYSFASGVQPGTDFDTAAAMYPSGQSAVASLGAIEDAKSWVLLRHIQADPMYRTLVDQAFEPIIDRIERVDPGVYYRAGWIFSASPNTCTPFHIDRSHVLLLQVHGTKTVYVWDPTDRATLDDLVRDDFHARHDLSRAHWQEAFRERAHVFHLKPGTGVYMPLTSPHMVETSQEASRTVSFTYNTTATRRVGRIHVLRDALRRMGLKSPPVGSHTAFDTAAWMASSALIACGGPGGHPPACPSLKHAHAYAVDD
jgi:hypothetical protein